MPNSAAKVKIISIKPNQKFSLQYHNRRAEFWTITSGSGKVRVGDLEREVSLGDFIEVPRKAVHRAEAYDGGLEFVEVQMGGVDESDIVRLEDDYGRVKKNG